MNEAATLRPPRKTAICHRSKQECCGRRCPCFSLVPSPIPSFYHIDRLYMATFIQDISDQHIFSPLEFILNTAQTFNYISEAQSVNKYLSETLWINNPAHGTIPLAGIVGNKARNIEGVGLKAGGAACIQQNVSLPASESYTEVSKLSGRADLKPAPEVKGAAGSQKGRRDT